jgi:hypothetical protein
MGNEPLIKFHQFQPIVFAEPRSDVACDSAGTRSGLQNPPRSATGLFRGNESGQRPA